MPGSDSTFFDEFLNRRLEPEQAQRVGDRGAVFSGAISHLFLRQMKFFREALKGARLLDRIEIFALEIFDQRHLQCHFLRNVAQDNRNACQSRALRRTPATLTGDELVAAPYFADDKRLNDPA